MTSNDPTSLLQALRDLFLKVSNFNLLKRIHSYHPSGYNMSRDISASLVKHIDELVAEYKPDSARVGDSVTPSLSSEHQLHSVNHTDSDTSPKSKVLDGLASHFATSSRREESDQYMGERLKASTLSHIHAASMQARQGEAAKAKLHADIANQALKEAAHYLSTDDYRLFCAEVENVINGNSAAKH